METKQYLKQISRMEKMIQNKLAEIYQLKTMAYGVTASGGEKERVQSSPDQDKLGNAVSKIVDLESETDRLVDRFLAKRNHIINQIDSMENSDYYDILSLKYVFGHSFEEIADKTGWSIRQVFRIHGRALQEFERLFGYEYLQVGSK